MKFAITKIGTDPTHKRLKLKVLNKNVYGKQLILDIIILFDGIVASKATSSKTQNTPQAERVETSQKWKREHE